MAPSKKSVKEVSAPENGQEDDSDSSENEEMESDKESVDDEENVMDQNMVVPVEFEGRNIEGDDFHSVKKLIGQLFLKAPVNISELTDIILTQNYVGSVLKQLIPEDEMDDDEDDDIMDSFGVTTLVNLTQRQDKDCVEQLFSFILEQAQREPSVAQKFEELLREPSTNLGLLLNERFINLPCQVAVPLLESLRKEVNSALKNKDRKRFFELTHVMMISKIHKPIESKKLRKKKANPNNQDIPDLLWTNSEEEIIFKEASFSFDYSVRDESDTALGGAWGEEDEEWEPIRRVFVFPFEKFSGLVDKLKDEIQ